MDKQKFKFVRNWLIAAIILFFIVFYQLPYYISTPGMARELDSMVEVENGFNEEEGTFMLTTVRIGQANIVQYAWAKLNDYHKIYPEELIRPHGETEDEYHNRQIHMMDSSQKAATYVAYKHAKKQVELKSHGVFVVRTLEGMPADEQLQIGDLIIKVDGIEVTEAEQLIDYVSGKKEGDVVQLDVIRNEKERKVNVKLAKFPDQQDKVGLGIQLVTNQELHVEPEVKIHSKNIGGPSAGLMFSLEIYNQLVEKDITKGYKIAGTGTINYEGEVGPIGGIEQKVVAADQAGAEIFFAPNAKGEEESNYELAVKAAKDIQTSMKIVPVDTFSDALQYLVQLPPKK